MALVTEGSCDDQPIDGGDRLPAGTIRSREPLATAVHASWAAVRSALARAAVRRRLARSIAHLDDRLLADAGLSAQQRGLGERLMRFAASSQISPIF